MTAFGVMKKELLETVRDRRTLTISVFIPIMMMPLMMGVFIYLTQQGATEMKLSISAPPGAQAVVEALAAPPVRLVDSNDSLVALQGGRLDVVVSVAPAGGKSRFSATVFHTAEATSVQAAEIVSARLAKLGKKIATGELSYLGVDTSILEPIGLKFRRVDTDRRSNLPGVFLSLIVIIWATVGAMYPAADVTAGEKERQTLETLLMTPTRDLQVILGKFASVYIVSLFTLVLAVFATIATVSIGDVKGLMLHVSGNVVLVSLEAIVVILATTALISAAEMAASAFAKSFREAQSYLTPIFMVVIVPGILPTVVPKITFNQILYYVPFMNNTLMINELSLGVLNMVHFGLLVITSAGLTAVLLYLTARLLRGEKVHRWM